MPKVNVYNILGEQVEDIDLKDDIFDVEVNETAMCKWLKIILQMKTRNSIG